METVIYYVLLNVVLFGGLYALSKLVEYGCWYVLENYEAVEAAMLDRFRG